METEIKLVYKDLKKAKAISEAISPDNIKTPADLSIQTSWTKKTLITTVKYDGDNIMTFLSTIDDVLSCVSIAEKAFTATKKARHS